MFIRRKTRFYIGLPEYAALIPHLIILGMFHAASASAQDAEIISLNSGEHKIVSLNDTDRQNHTLLSSDLGQTTQKMSVSELEQRLREHPSLDALSLSASADRLRAESALALPDPVVSLQLNNIALFDPSFTEYLPSNKAVGIRQSLPSRSGRKANSLKSLRQAAQAEIAREEKFAKIRGRVYALIIARAGLKDQKHLISQKLAKYDELKDIIDIEISAGRPLLFRIAQIDIERADKDRELTELEQKIDVINAELVNWLGVIPETDLPAIQKTPLTGNALQYYGVRVADAVVEISDAEVQKAEADFKPDWGVNLTYQQRESGQGPRSNFDGEDWVSGGVSFTIPLWSGRRQTPNLKAAKTDKQSAMATRMAMARHLNSQWRQYEARRAASVKNIRILKQKNAALSEQSGAQLIQYESGTGDYSPIIDAEIAALTLETQIIKEASLRDQMVVMMNSLVVTP